MRAALITVLVLAACSDPPPPVVRSESPILTAVEAPAPALEGSLIRVTGIAIEVVQLIQSVLAGRPVSGGADIAARQATNIRFFREKVAPQHRLNSE